MIVVVNYHRIGDPLDAANPGYDPALFEATVSELSDQVAWLKRLFHVATLDEVQDLVEHPERLRHPVFHITLDDGYIDNYTMAFPVFRSHGVPATFFLATKLVGSYA